MSAFNAWSAFYPECAVLILQFARCLHFALSLQFAAPIGRNLPLDHSLNFAVCRQHDILTITMIMKHNCIQCDVHLM